MKLYNTLTKKKEEFVPLEPGKVKMYVCGPTVYNFIHIGNARPMIVFDTARRYMEHKGYEVNYVSNFTDVDDKIIAKANEEGVSSKEVSERYIKECQKDMAASDVYKRQHGKRLCLQCKRHRLFPHPQILRVRKTFPQKSGRSEKRRPFPSRDW